MPFRRKKRTHAGRVQHQRIKPRAGQPPSAAEKRFHDRIAQLGCEACGGPAEIHHILHAPETGNQRCHRLVVGLCPFHHRQGPQAVHVLGSEEAFDAAHGTALLERARQHRFDEFGELAA